jgi:hypothetical protein
MMQKEPQEALAPDFDGYPQEQRPALNLQIGALAGHPGSIAK